MLALVCKSLRDLAGSMDDWVT